MNISACVAGLCFLITDAMAVPRASDLVETGSLQRRWMSLPGSRVVVNPYDFYSQQTPLEYSAGPQLPLHVGYYVNGVCANLRNELMLHQRLHENAGELRVGWSAPIKQDGSWAVDPHLDVREEGDALVIAATARNGDCSNCGAISQTVDVDMIRHPWIRIHVTEAKGMWALKVRDAVSPKELALQTDTNASGMFSYDVSKLTGWSGRKRIEIKLYAVGLGKSIRLSRLEFVGMGDAAFQTAQDWDTSWTPHQLCSNVTFPDIGRVSARDAFVTTDSLQRRYDFSALQRGAKLAISGNYQGKLTYSSTDQMLVVENSSFTLALAMRGADLGQRATVFQTSVEQLGGIAVDQPLKDAPAIWSLDLVSSATAVTSESLVVGIGFATSVEGRELAEGRAIAATKVERPDLEQERYWNSFIARVPQVENYALKHVDTLGVSAQEIEAAYYKAWVFTAINVLPIMPETGFMFPQLAAGKPSMWAEGHPLALATASWDSLFGIQLYAHVDAAVAWDCFSGLMSLVDEEGRLGGESLPSRKAQTALILYQLRKDRDRLAAVYPAIKRYLLWRRDNPRWIHRDHDYIDEKDSDFVASAIFDMKCAAEIASELGNPEDTAMWQKERAQLFQNYLQWFWKEPTASPAEYYFTDRNSRSWGNSLWTASGIVTDLLTSGPQLDGLYRRLAADEKPALPFLGHGYPKHPEMQFVANGLINRGRNEDAARFIDTAIRDVTRANMFAEQYGVNTFPTPDGVRPSMFGAAMLIDMLWLKNGITYLDGRKRPVTLPGESGGVVFH